MTDMRFAHSISMQLITSSSHLHLIGFARPFSVFEKDPLSRISGQTSAALDQTGTALHHESSSNRVGGYYSFLSMTYSGSAQKRTMSAFAQELKRTSCGRQWRFWKQDWIQTCLFEYIALRL